MSRVVLYIAISLDGFIADRDGSVDWLSAFGSEDEDFGYHVFYGTVGATISGATTYEQVLTFGDFPYSGVENVVVTSRALPTPAGEHEVRFYQGDLLALVDDLRARHTKDIWLIGGGKLVSAFVSADLIDEYRITVMPTLLGEGIPLFPAISGHKMLRLVRSQTFTQGVVELVYTPAR